MERSNAHTLDWNGNGWYAGNVQANNVPYVASEKVVLTVPAASISAKKTEITNASLDRPVTINVGNTMVYDPTKIYCLKYNNIQYRGVYITDRVTIMEDKCVCTFISENGSTMLMIGKLDTTNITDIQLIEKDIKKLDNMYIPNDLKVSNSITVGVRSGTVGRFSSSFGIGCVASGYCSHVEGNSSTASGEESHAEGQNSIASGLVSHAEGWNTEAKGKCSHAEGENSIASSDNQHVQGRYNIEDTNGKYAHIVGNGTNNKKSNAHTLDWNGNAWYAGKLSQEGIPTQDKDLITKKYFDNGISSLPQVSFNENGELVVTINGVSKIFVPKS